VEETFNSNVIILDRFKFREFDIKLIVWSEEYGKLELIARGASRIKSKIAGHIEPITISRLMIIRGKRVINYVGSATGDVFFDSIKSNLEKIKLSGNVLRLVKKLSREGEGSGVKIFSLLNDFLNTINNNNIANYDLLYYFFVLKFLSRIGVAPNFKKCLKCKNSIHQVDNYFDIGNGGIICGNCTPNNSFKISIEAIKVLNFCLNNKFSKLNNLKIDNKIQKEIKDKIKLFYKYHF